MNASHAGAEREHDAIGLVGQLLDTMLRPARAAETGRAAKARLVGREERREPPSWKTV
jgi:hypothetical protein